MEKRVLIVDDSAVSRMLLKGMIRERCPDWVIVEARNAEEALASVGEASPDLITLDIGMPGMNGLELAVKLKEQVPDAQLAIVTANVQDAMRRRIQALGILFAAVVEKPATPAAVDKMLYFVEGDD